MLINSPRITPADQKAWDRLEQYDELLADMLPLDTMEQQALKIIEDFARDGRCYASTSWGKDSTVMAHLIAISNTRIPLVWVRVKHWENPDCDLVRNQFLTMHPHMRDQYDEIEIETTKARWWEPESTNQPETRRTFTAGFKTAEQRYGPRHISGIRAEESRIRTMVQSRWGNASKNACRPIGTWEATEIFAYLHSRNLPVHPAYAQSVGGQMDRRWLRVASLGGRRGADRGRAEWEARYYPDIIHAQAHATPQPDATPTKPDQ